MVEEIIYTPLKTGSQKTEEDQNPGQTSKGCRQCPASSLYVLSFLTPLKIMPPAGDQEFDTQACGTTSNIASGICFCSIKGVHKAEQEARNGGLFSFEKPSLHPNSSLARHLHTRLDSSI